MQWFKFYGGEYLSDPKILQLDANERSCWVTLLALASQSDEGIVKFLSEQQLLILSGVSDKISGILEKFEKLDMIRTSNGIVTVSNWEKRQYSEGYTRVKNFRKRQSNTEDNDRVDKNRKKERIDKSIYGEFKKVFLTHEEYQKLIERFKEKNALLLIAELDSYIASTGKRYASHYATLLNWGRRKIQEHINKPTKGKQIIGL